MNFRAAIPPPFPSCHTTFAIEPICLLLFRCMGASQGFHLHWLLEGQLHHTHQVLLCLVELYPLRSPTWMKVYHGKECTREGCVPSLLCELNNHQTPMGMKSPNIHITHRAPFTHSYINTHTHIDTLNYPPSQLSKHAKSGSRVNRTRQTGTLRTPFPCVSLPALTDTPAFSSKQLQLRTMQHRKR